MYNRAEAACKAFGVPMSKENGVDCIEKLVVAGLDVVYVEELGEKRPIIMGKEAIIRDSVTYKTYVDDTQIAPEPSTTPTCPYCLHHPTQQIHTTPNTDIYQEYENISNTTIRGIVASHIPNVSKVPMATFSQWLSYLPSATSLVKRKRDSTSQVHVRNMWFLLEHQRNQAVANLFNEKMYIDSVKSGDCITIGYARKSHSNIARTERIRLLEGMASTLVDPCLCRKVYVTPICASDSPLLQRDGKLSSIRNIRNSHGDMQDMISYIKTSVRQIRLVTLDYAGLTTSPQDLSDFISLFPIIMFVVVYHGHKFESFSREALLKVDGCNPFACRKAPVRRSQL